MKWTNLAYVCVSMVAGVVVYQLFQQKPDGDALFVAAFQYCMGAAVMFLYVKWFGTKGERDGD